MTMNQKKALYAFGCPDREATVNRFCTLAELAPRICKYCECKYLS